MTAWTGYANPDYAGIYSALGAPVALPISGGTLLRRKIPGTDMHDLMGCYPVFCCADWSALRGDIAALGQGDVSVVLVADPFLDGGKDRLSQIFDIVRPFKTHYIADLSQPLDHFVPAKRLREAHRALRKLEVEVAPTPSALVDDWMDLQARSRHAAHASGVNRLSRDEAARLFDLPEIVILRALDRGRTVGMHVEIQQGDVVFGHFATYDPDAYRLGVSPALHLCELEHFTGRARWYDHGGVPGTEDANNGLSRFKQDFSNTTRTAFLCGSVLDRDAYDRLSAQGITAKDFYFPAYRAAERGRPRHDPQPT